MLSTLPSPRVRSRSPRIGFRHVVQSRFDAFQARFRVDQELRRHDDPLARLQAALDFGLPPLSMPVSTSTGRNVPSSSASITTVRLPV